MQIPGEVPEGSRADNQVRITKVPVHRVPEGSGADT